MKHHYIPAFYLRQWANGPKAELCEHKKVYGTVQPRRTSAEGTGYLEDLYRVEGVPAEDAHHFELKFMQLVDTDAHRALQKIISDPHTPWPGRLRSAWTRFIISLLFRNPETVELLKTQMVQLWQLGSKALQDDYAAWRRPTDPQKFEDFFALTNPAAPAISASNMLAEIIDNDRVGPTVFDMNWSRVNLKGSNVPLLTSDRPLDMPLGLGQKNAYIALPIGPYDLFIAAYNADLARKAQDENPTKIVKNLNLAIVKRARLLVWGVDDGQLGFIRKHFGKFPDREVLTQAQLDEARDAARGIARLSVPERD